MKKIFLNIALLILIASTLPNAVNADVPSNASAKLLAVKTLEIQGDFRIAAIKNVLDRNNSPISAQAENFVKYADENGVDWKLLPAISGVESTYGNFLLDGSYNAYGWGGGYIYFKNWSNGIQTITRALKENYIDRLGTDDVYAIGGMYAESKTWASRVTANMAEINAEYLKLTTQNLPLTI